MERPASTPARSWASTEVGRLNELTGRRPNVVLILVDDMGFADLGCTGSEIRTPNLDRLAANGALLSQMYNGARCCPTRASLLTGLSPHSAGVGHMGADLGTPAYQGRLRNDTATIAEHLRADGYRTLMAGKWHVAGDVTPREFDEWTVRDLSKPTPRQRGFDRFFGILDGATHFFSPEWMVDDDQRVGVTSDDFHFTDEITRRAIDMVDEAVDVGDPFFLYFAHAAPHWPLHAWPEDIARYDGVYDAGWDATRTARHETLNSLGVLDETWAISPRDPDAPAWADVEHKQWEATRMAAYAAMVEHMDRSVGELIDALHRNGTFDDTLILFLSDNGGCAEFMAEDGWAKYYPDHTHDGQRIVKGNLPGLPPGDALTFQSYDTAWANVSNAPFRLFKHWVHEGGISTPLIAHWPGRVTAGTVHAPCHVSDVLPTILQATQAAPLTELSGHALQPLEGESFLPLLEGEPWQRSQPICLEHEGNAAIRLGQFKLVRRHGQPWELYDMHTDRTELDDQAGRLGGLERELQGEWQSWASRVGVLEWNVAEPLLLAAWGLDSIDG